MQAASTPGLGWAGRILRRQLDTLARLAAIALRKAGLPTVGARAVPAARPPARAGWVLRLIEALRLKLDRDLRRLERAEPTTVAAANRKAAPLPSLAERIAAELESLRADIAAIERGERPAFLDAWPPETEGPEAEDVEGGEFEAVNFETGDRAMRRRQDRDRGRAEFADILERPTDEILALICRELGLPADWLDEAQAAFEAEEDRRAPNVPFPLDGGWVRDGGGALSGEPPPG